MPVFTKTFTLFADSHHSEGRHRSSVGKNRGSSQSKRQMNRTEQLGLPPPRKLMCTKEEFRYILEERRLQNFDKHLEKSLATIYARMVAEKPVQQQQQQQQKKRRSCFKKSKSKKNKNSSKDNSKQEYEKWLMNISKPKKIFFPEELERVKGNIDINRITRLARPRYQPCPDPETNDIPRATLKYVATERILSLAKPKQEKCDNIVFGIPRISFPVNPDYASIKSRGTEKLAIPLRQRTKYLKVNVDVRCSYDPVSRGALQYEASDKIRKLAKAKTYEDDEASDPYQVKKKALRKLQKKQENIFKKMSTPIEWKVTPKYESQ